MSIIENLHTFLTQCPFLKTVENSLTPKVYIDYLAQKPTAYGIEITPSSQVVRKYVDGGGIKQTTFAFVCLKPYEGKNITLNIDNISFFERLSEWMEKTRPDIDGWIKVEPLTDGYFADIAEDPSTAVYRIQCRVLYNF